MIMKRLVSLVCAISATVSCLLAMDAVRAGEPSSNLIALVAGNNQFACDAYAQLADQPGNLFLSPFSVSTALAMAYAGAKGETATQMEQALHFTLPQETLHPAFGELNDHIQVIEAAGHVKLCAANSLWPHNACSLLEDYFAQVKKSYGVSITPVDYEHNEPQARAQINNWVAAKTENRITNLIAGPLSPLTRLVLVNAIYFKGNWAESFKTNCTQNAPFFVPIGEPAPTALMEQTHTFLYADLDTFQILALPYRGWELSMLVLLPKGSNALAAVEHVLSPDALKQWRQAMMPESVHVFLPRFKITWGTTSLAKPLQELGMRNAFSSAGLANFSGMDGQRDLYISDVLHKAFVDVNETGTEAAAATAVTMKALGVYHPRPPVVFRADHPFLFMIQENSTGSILFMGRLMTPDRSGF